MSDFVVENGILKKYTGIGGDVVIPDEVIKIGNKAFEWCKNLQNVTIPKNIAKIGNNAFHGCENLQNVIIPEGVKKIEDRTFCGCKKLQNIVIPKSVIEIGKDAFCGCESLQNIAIPENVTVIEGAFSYCKNLQSIVVPKSVVKISDGTFFGCTKIKLIVLDEKLLFCTESMVDSSYGLVVKSENGISLFARSSKTLSNNKIDFIDKGDWNAYDVDIINNGPCYKYRAEARFLGALGRLNDPVDLTDECKELYVELLVKNAKKLIPIAEEIDCPEIVEMMIKHEIINDGNRKAINKLLKASANEKIAAFAE